MLGVGIHKVVYRFLINHIEKTVGLFSTNVVLSSTVRDKLIISVVIRKLKTYFQTPLTFCTTLNKTFSAFSSIVTDT